jgi:hypothetical protein
MAPPDSDHSQFAEYRTGGGIGADSEPARHRCAVPLTAVVNAAYLYRTKAADTQGQPNPGLGVRT